MSMAATSEWAKEKNRQQHKEEYMWYKSRGICPRCRTNYAEPGRVYCAGCCRRIIRRKDMLDPDRARRNQYSADRRQALKEQGMCVDCGRVKAAEGKTRCSACQRRSNESNRVYRIRQRIDREVERALERTRNDAK